MSIVQKIQEIEAEVMHQRERERVGERVGESERESGERRLVQSWRTPVADPPSSAGLI